jgi:hypothetical protein
VAPDGDAGIALDGGVIAHAAEQAVGDARRAAAAPGQFAQRGILGVELQQLGVLAQNFVQRLRGVKINVLGDAEAAAHGAGEQADARRGADQREALDRHGDRARVHAGVDGDVHLVIFHRGIEIFLHQRPAGGESRR